MNKFYLTSAIPYVNAKPHIGHALEYIYADTIARYHKLLGDEVKTLCGADENALKNVQAAEKAGKEVQNYVDENAEYFKQLAKKLNVQFDVFQKGSAPNHYEASQKLWELCNKSGDIYKKSYKGLYCVGCELFYTKDELNEKGECIEHPGKPLEEVEEENYFFKLSKYQKHIYDLIQTNAYEITPDFRKNEVLSFLRQPLQDISISRSNERAKNWGVPVPNDPNQRMYVWFDALNIYQSGIGFNQNEEEYKKWWPADVHVIGKGIIRFHAIYWPAILLSAHLKIPKKLFVHEYFTVNGQKMSKSIGNVFDPIPLLEKYGQDPLRYFCLAKISPFQDGDFSEEKFVETYTSDLANGIGNLVARVAKLCETNAVSSTDAKKEISSEVKDKLAEYKFNEAIGCIWKNISEVDKKINSEEPWKLSGEQLGHSLQSYITVIQQIAIDLQPFLPETAEKILNQFNAEKIVSSQPLFPRM